VPIGQKLKRVLMRISLLGFDVFSDDYVLPKPFHAHILDKDLLVSSTYYNAQVIFHLNPLWY